MDRNLHLEPSAKEGGAKAEDSVDGHLGSEPSLVVDRGGQGPFWSVYAASCIRIPPLLPALRYRLT